MKGKSRTDWNRLNRMTDEEINYSEIPPLDDDFFKTGKLRVPEAKPMISIRMDPVVLKWFRSQGKGYQTRINAVLRMYMESQIAK
ncbi:MAG: BrnA antitoxin family protein [Chloroflexota bacterium]|nr:BrnA antitoxin family protein [Chloroflexota bacterium]